MILLGAQHPVRQAIISTSLNSFIDDHCSAADAYSFKVERPIMKNLKSHLSLKQYAPLMQGN